MKYFYFIRAFIWGIYKIEWYIGNVWLLSLLAVLAIYFCVNSYTGFVSLKIKWLKLQHMLPHGVCGERFGVVWLCPQTLGLSRSCCQSVSQKCQAQLREELLLSSLTWAWQASLPSCLLAWAVCFLSHWPPHRDAHNVSASSRGFWERERGVTIFSKPNLTSKVTSHSFYHIFY